MDFKVATVGKEFIAALDVRLSDVMWRSANLYVDLLLHFVA